MEPDARSKQNRHTRNAEIKPHQEYGNSKQKRNGGKYTRSSRGERRTIEQYSIISNNLEKVLVPRIVHSARLSLFICMAVISLGTFSGHVCVSCCFCFLILPIGEDKVCSQQGRIWPLYCKSDRNLIGFLLFASLPQHCLAQTLRACVFDECEQQRGQIFQRDRQTNQKTNIHAPLRPQIARTFVRHPV